jgi:hypothetical protein
VGVRPGARHDRLLARRRVVGTAGSP